MHLVSHVKWFVEEQMVVPVGYGALDWLAVALLLALGVAIALVVEKYWHPVDQKIDKRLAKFRKYTPTIIGVVSGGALVIATLRGFVIAPNISTDFAWLQTVQLIVGISWILGAGVRYTATAMVGIYGLLLFDNPLMNIVEHLEILAASVVLFSVGRGPYSLVGSESIGVSPILRDRAARAYIQIVGASLVALAFGEKLLSPALSEAFMASHHWNFLQGIGVHDRTFILVIGTLELLFGVLLVLNIVPRLVVLAVLGAMLTTAVLLGIEEVYGHLFAVAVVLVAWTGYQPISNAKAAKTKRKKPA